MTVPWAAQSRTRRVSRPPSLVAVVVGVLIALVAQVGTLVVLRSTIAPWLPDVPLPGLSPTAPADPSGAPGTPRPEQTTGPVAVTDAIQRGVVLIKGRTGNTSVAGTGMVLTADGYVLTNYHVVRSTSEVTVTIALTGRTFTATMVGRDATKDVALLKLKGARDLEVIQRDTDTVSVGDVVIAAGNANGQGYVTAHRGNVQLLDAAIFVRSANENDPPQELRGLIGANAAAWPGDSGGPLYDAEGQVLGMTTAGGAPDGTDEDATDKKVYAVPLAHALAVVDQIQAGDESGTVVIGPKAYLGVVVTDADGDLRINTIESGTPAAKAGLKAQDVILALDGATIRTRADLSTTLDGIEPGETVSLTWRAAATGRERTGTITVGTSPVN